MNGDVVLEKVETSSGAGGTVYQGIRPAEGEKWIVMAIDINHDDAGGARNTYLLYYDGTDQLRLTDKVSLASTDNLIVSSDENVNLPIVIDYDTRLQVNCEAMAASKTLTTVLAVRKIPDV
jgi:hypothetical protein